MPFDRSPGNASVQIAAVADGAVRAGPLVGIPSLLRSLGQDPTTVFATAECDLHLLDDPENVVPFAVAGRMLDACVWATDCAHFGLLLGQQNGIECLGMVGMLVRHSPTLKHALRNLILHLHLHDRGAVPSLSLSDGEARLSYTIYQPGVAATGQIYDLSAAVAYDVLRTVCGPDWRPLAVHLPHAKPQDLEPYRRVFGLTPCFDAEQMTLVFAADWLLQPVPGADPETFRSLEAQIDDLSSRVYGDLPSRVRRIACNLLHCGSGSLESAAEVLSVHPRTLDRRLQRFGTTYRQIRDECKQALASHLLVETELSIPEIADRLQYASVSAFTRAFGRWNGSAPAAWRASRRKAWLNAAPGPAVGSELVEK